MSKPTTAADRRPRIHAWKTPTGAAVSFGPCGQKIAAQSIGQGVEIALDAIGHEPAVIIFEGAAHG